MHHHINPLGFIPHYCQTSAAPAVRGPKKFNAIITYLVKSAFLLILHKKFAIKEYSDKDQISVSEKNDSAKSPFDIMALGLGQPSILRAKHLNC